MALEAALEVVVEEEEVISVEEEAVLEAASVAVAEEEEVTSAEAEAAALEEVSKIFYP